ncbi:CRTAC1 family protein [Rhodohalobacter mucosus]|uniref:CRTAC1 family protein n=1 Tax=Rhodohalobacter mucosus TaxID=2079485 RepID=A0A316TTQ0_9BACT|nr:CRTAC1 family protein [Rhodohalobacter mucosus]PWN06689.1 CRTAC1 family protein [Rhodohalobacter mucosus]
MKRETLTRIAAAVIFALLISIPFGMRTYSDWMSSDDYADREDVLQRYGFYLEDITEAAGVDFSHQRVTVDDELSHILPQISSVGASVSVADFNNDGYPDLYFTSSEFGTPNALYQNMGDGTFTDVGEEMGVAALNSAAAGASMGSVWGDFDNDGYEDLLVYRWGSPELFRNLEGSGFEPVTDGAGLNKKINSNTAFWFDYNRDGFLDLFIGGYYHEDVNLFDLEDTRMMPDSYEYATNGGLNYLYRNNGDGTFTDVSEESGLQETRKWTLASTAADINNSGYPDIILANDYGVDEVLLNCEGRVFENVGEETGIGFVPKSGMSASLGDFMNRGEYSIYITNISEAGVLMQGNNLWVPSSSTESESGVPGYRNLAGNMGVEIGEWGYGGQFVDLNNDGYLDLYVANGYVSDEPGTDYWYDYSRVVGGNRNIIIDANNWPAMNSRSFSGYQTNKIWLNDGAGRFREVAGAVGGSLSLDSRSVAYADLDGSGNLDLIVANQNQPVKIFKNQGQPDRNWVGFRLTGTESNRSAIGAEVFLYWDGRITRKMVSGGESFSSQSQRAVHFGMGEVAEAEKAEIRWPSGNIDVIEKPELNRYHSIIESED